MVETTSPSPIIRTTPALLPNLFERVQNGSSIQSLETLLDPLAAREREGNAQPPYGVALSAFLDGQAEFSNYLANHPEGAKLNLAIALYLSSFSAGELEGARGTTPQINLNKFTSQMVRRTSGRTHISPSNHSTLQYSRAELEGDGGFFIAAQTGDMDDIAYSLVVVNRPDQERQADAFIAVTESGGLRTIGARRWLDVDSAKAQWWMTDAARRLEYGMRASYNVPVSCLHRALEQNIPKE